MQKPWWEGGDQFWCQKKGSMFWKEHSISHIMPKRMDGRTQALLGFPIQRETGVWENSHWPSPTASCRSPTTTRECYLPPLQQPCMKPPVLLIFIHEHEFSPIQTPLLAYRVFLFKLFQCSHDISRHMSKKIKRAVSYATSDAPIMTACICVPLGRILENLGYLRHTWKKINILHNCENVKGGQT